jgi:hypothetical protein
VFETAVLNHPPESRKKLAFYIIASNNLLNTFINDTQDPWVIMNLLVCVKLLCKVCSQSYHDVVIKKLHKGQPHFQTMSGPHPLTAEDASNVGSFQEVP